MLDENPTNAERYRADEAVDAEPIAVLGAAIIDLVMGRLPQPEPGTSWAFGFERQPTFISMRPGAPPG
jgi:hypothetical protein